MWRQVTRCNVPVTQERGVGVFSGCICAVIDVVFTVLPDGKSLTFTIKIRVHPMKHALLTIIGLLLFTTCGTADNGANQTEQPPNIIYIMADDLGYADLGCYGQEKIKTPHIDALASQGMRFTQQYSGAPVCAPARCVLMTGMHLGHAYVRDNWENRDGKFDDFGGQLPLPPETITVAEQLKAAGYATGAFGKWGLGGVGTVGDPLNQGFDRFFGFNCQRHAHNLYPKYLVDDDRQRFLPGNDRGLTGDTYGPQAVADELLKFIRDNKDGPFFAYYPTVIPHLALQAPEEEIAKYRGLWDDPPYEGKSYLPHPTPKACYAAMISFLDKQIGRVVSLLDELGLADNTVIIFTSDNGVTHLGEQVDYEFFESAGDFRGLKGSVYEGGIRTPMIVRWPGKVAPGTISDLMGSFYDVMPTLCDIAGAEQPPATDGISIVPTILGQSGQQEHEFLLWEFHGHGGQQAVRMGDWKGVRVDCYTDANSPLELYNLGNDIGESTNVAAQHPDIVAKIEEIMKREHINEATGWDFTQAHPRRR